MSDVEYDDNYYPGLGGNNGAGMEGDNSSVSSNDDDGVIDFVGSKNGKKRGGFGYTTFGNNDSEEDEEEDGMRRKRRKRDGGGGKEEALYGVFAHNSSDEEGGEDHRGGRRRRKRGLNTYTSNNNAVNFVKSTTTTDEEENIETNSNTEQNKKKEKEKKEIEEEKKEEMMKLKQKEEEANAQFYALLKRGREGSSSTTNYKRTENTRRNIHSNFSSSFTTEQNKSKEETKSKHDTFMESSASFTTPAAAAGLGLGASSGGGLGSTGNVGMGFTQFVSSSSQPYKPQPKIKRDPNIGKWEKHTKGIGMKLLTKMGYSGTGGLGSNKRKRSLLSNQQQEPNGDNLREGGDVGGLGFSPSHQEEEEKTVRRKKGISRPVQVVVRPANLGLGYGSFTEMTKLKNNQTIEAEVRGLPTPAEKEALQRKKNEGGKEEEDEVLKSLLPSADTILQEKAWKKRENNRKKKKEDNTKIVSYTEVLELNKQHQQKQGTIIDMRGPSSTVVPLAKLPSSSSTQTQQQQNSKKQVVQLGEELLYNITYLLNSYEDELKSTSSYVSSTQEKVKSLKMDVLTIQKRVEEQSKRSEKLHRVLKVMDEMDNFYDSFSSDENDGKMDTKQAEEKITKMIVQLGKEFTLQEQEELKYDSIVIPSLLGPFVENVYLQKWNSSRSGNKHKIENVVLDSGPRVCQEIVMQVLNLVRCVVVLRDDDVIENSNTNNNSSSNNSNNEDKRRREIERVLFIKHILPRVKKAFQSSASWDPMVNVENGVSLYEALMECLNDNDTTTTSSLPHEEKGGPQHLFDFQGKGEEEMDEDVYEELLAAETRTYKTTTTATNTKTLVKIIQEEVMFDTIYPRLSRALSQWKPEMIQTTTTTKMTTFDLRTRTLRYPIHSWIVPWLPHLNNRSMLRMMLPDIKRKVKSALSYYATSTRCGGGEGGGTARRMGKKEEEEDEETKMECFLKLCLQVLKPWRLILDTLTIHNLVSESVVPRLGRYLSKMVISTSISSSSLSLEQHWSRLDVLFDWYNDGLLSKLDFVSLVEGEVMSNWADSLHRCLSLKIKEKKNGHDDDDDKDISLKDVAEFYSVWRMRMMMQPKSQRSLSSTTYASPSSWMVLQKDDMICRHFCGGLLMIHSVLNNDEDAFEELTPPLKEECNYRVASARRSREEHMKEEIQRNKRASASERGKDGVTSNNDNRDSRMEVDVTTTTFRDVVEDFARQHDVPFHLRTAGGPSTTKDGKQIFMFGTVPVFFDSNVVFALRGSKWQPISLDHLVCTM